MTEVVFKKSRDIFYYASADGHADGELEARVCAGISTLMSGLYFSLIEVCGLRETQIKDSQSDGFIAIETTEMLTSIEVQSCFKFALTSLKMMRDKYPDYLDIEILEV